MDKPITIYALCDPETGEVRYVGQTSMSLRQRRYAHVNDLATSAAKRQWIIELRRRGLKPDIKALAVAHSSTACSVEQSYINDFIMRGARLTNAQCAPTTPRAPIDDPHDKRVQVRVSSDAAEEVIEEARHQRRTIAEMLRVIVEEWADGRRSRKP